MTDGATPEAAADQVVPPLGLGTWQNDEPGRCAESVRLALEMGYRHVDTAQAYGNERAVGRGIASADVDREDVVLATKVWTDKLGHDDVLASTEESLERLGTDYLDLLYVHWPANQYDPEETLSAFRELREDGLVDHVGVSNFEPEHLETARDVLGEPPLANQVEMHPLLQQRELREYCADTGIELVAYSPLAKGSVFELEAVSEIADVHGVSAAQVSLAWLREKGVASIPKATGEEHLRDNWASLELELTEDDVARIDAVEATERKLHPNFAPDSW